MSLVHIVMFQFKPEVSPADAQKACDAFLNLKTTCIHPTTQESYIVSSSGGSDISIEGMQHGITHAFVVRFNSVEDRDYYVTKDPAHQAFVQLALPLVVKAQVIDYIEGQF